MYQFFILFHKTYKPPFRGWLSTATTSRNHAAIPQKEAIESPEMERFWLIKYQRNKGGKIVVTCFENSVLHHRIVSARQLLSGFEDKVVFSRMARKLNLQAVSSLFAPRYSEKRCIIVTFSSGKLTNLLFVDS